LMAIGNLALSQADYMNVIEAKTAKLFEAAGALGAIAAGGSASDEIAMATYARELGVAFQIADDVLDYRGDADVLGKSLGDDLAEGKLTLPIILALAQSGEADSNWLKSVIEANRSAHRHSDLPRVLALLERCGALDASMSVAEKHARAAERAIEKLPETRAKTAMLELCRYAIHRNE
jgi:octaprenyl-diphosphate synthase